MIGESSSCGGKSRAAKRAARPAGAVARQVWSCAAAFWTIPRSPYRLQSSCRIMPAAFRRTGRMRGGASARSISGGQRRDRRRDPARRGMFISPGPYAERGGAIWSFFVGRPEAGRLSPGFSGKRKQHESGRCLPAGRRRHLWFITKFTRSIWPSFAAYKSPWCSLAWSWSKGQEHGRLLPGRTVLQAAGADSHGMRVSSAAAASMGRAGVAYSSGFKAIAVIPAVLLGMFIFSILPDVFPTSDGNSTSRPSRICLSSVSGRRPRSCSAA